MKHTIAVVFTTLLLTLSTATRADVLLLVHGYLSSASAWEVSGVNQILADNGWKRAGLYSAGGFAEAAAADAKDTKKVVLAELPSEAPIGIQSDLLLHYLQDISTRFAGERLIIVGHSAGGLVARLSMLRTAIPDLVALVTIATPHLGTQRAAQALDATDVPFPISIIPDFFGGSNWDLLKRGRSLYVDLLPPAPGTLLFWLNQQKHPDITYYSIVRGTPYALYGDSLVPGYSQDMNAVPVLYGKSKLVTVGSGHELNPQDGFALAGILSAF